MNSIAVSFDELDRRAEAVQSVINMLRLEVQRDTAYFETMYYGCVGKYEVHKFEAALKRCLHVLRPDQLLEIADILHEANTAVEPQIAVGHRMIGNMRWFERKTFSSFCRLVQRVAAIREQILEEARCRDAALALVAGPSLSVSQSRHAALAQAVFRPTHRDPAEDLTDPEYGF